MILDWVMLIPYLYATSQPKIALVTILISTLRCIIMTLIFFPRVGFLSVPLALSLASWINMFLLIRAHGKLNSFKLNSSLVMYSLKSLCFAVILFYFLRIVDIELSNYVLNNIYKLVIEFLLIVPLFVYFVYKMEVEMYKKMIFILRRLLKKIITL